MRGTMTANRWRGAVAAAVLIVAQGMHAGMAAETEINGVVFENVFPTPFLDPVALKSAGGVSVHLGLKVTNRTGGTLRFSTYLSVLPELLTRAGTVVPFDYGANRYPPARASDYPLLLPGQSLMIPLDGTMSYRGGQLNWKGSDGLIGFWKIKPPAAPYRFRLRYRQAERSMNDVEGGPGTINGIWTGEAATDTVGLPLSF
jgi:hypothetical protein